MKQSTRWCKAIEQRRKRVIKSDGEERRLKEVMSSFVVEDVQANGKKYVIVKQLLPKEQWIVLSGFLALEYVNQILLVLYQFDGINFTCIHSYCLMRAMSWWLGKYDICLENQRSRERREAEQAVILDAK